MGKRRNIGVDVDGVLSDFITAARTLLKEMYGKPDDALVQTTWAFESLGITAEEEKEMWKRIDSIPNWWMGHYAMLDTNLIVKLAAKHRVVFITNRKDGAGLPIEIQTSHWLVNLLDLAYPMVIISGNKGPVAAGLDLDYFIDDRPKNVNEVKLASPLTDVFLLDGTYNQTEPLVEGIYHVKSFNEFAHLILED